MKFEMDDHTSGFWELRDQSEKLKNAKMEAQDRKSTC
jgi:hypothetical protein